MSKKYPFNTSWFWKKDDYERVLELIKDFNNPIVHICSGVSEIGDYRIDANILKLPDRDWRMGTCNIQGDMLNLPLKSNIAGSVICDPPYNYDITNPTLISEIVRICKPKSKILFIAPWVPNHKNIKVINTDLWIVGEDRSYFKIKTLFYKSNAQLDDFLLSE